MPTDGSHALALTVNGESCSAEVEPRMLLADLLRDEFGLTGTHLGCEHGVCGACTVVMDGRPVRSCLTFAVQAAGRSVVTVEGLARGDDDLHPLQERFREEHALQCGFCTPGFLMTAFALLEEKPHASEDDVREALDGVLCRCTGYDAIVRAVLDAREEPAG
jgi:carbon-monoxide dehydrogenase small subunit